MGAIVVLFVLWKAGVLYRPQLVSAASGNLAAFLLNFSEAIGDDVNHTNLNTDSFQFQRIEMSFFDFVWFFAHARSIALKW